jgi:hypothetical protein
MKIGFAFWGPERGKRKIVCGWCGWCQFARGLAEGRPNHRCTWSRQKSDANFFFSALSVYSPCRLSPRAAGRPSRTTRSGAIARALSCARRAHVSLFQLSQAKKEVFRTKEKVLQKFGRSKVRSGVSVFFAAFADKRARATMTQSLRRCGSGWRTTARCWTTSRSTSRTTFEPSLLCVSPK